MAHIILTSNPCEPLKSTKILANRRIMLGSWLRKHYGKGFTEFATPTVITINGVALLRKDTEWKSRVLEKDDVVQITTLPLGPVAWLWVAVAILSVSVVALAVTGGIPKLQTGQMPNADPAFTLKGRSNQQKLGNPIEVQYGKVLRWPSYAAQPYNQYKNNQQWLYQLFCIGQGEYEIHSVNIGLSPVDNYQNVSYEIITPGNKPTLFPTNVITSADVNDIELLGPNQSSYPGYSGPFILVPSGKTTTKIECDVVFPSGLYKANSTGGLDTYNVTAQFQYQLINDSGVAIGPWTDLTGLNVSYASVNSQSITLESTVPVGRYQVRAVRTVAKSTNTQVSDRLVWSAMRCFLPDTNDYGNVALLAVAAQATNNLNSNSASQVNVLCTRKLPIYNPTTHLWSAPTSTRSPMWAACDILKSVYGGQLTDAYLDLDQISGLNDLYVTRGDHFDWVYDNTTTVWDALKLLGMAGRAVPTMNGSQVTFVRDQLQAIPTGVYGPDNIIKGTFQWQIKMPGYDYTTGLEVTYQDPTTYLQTTVNCVLPDEAGDKMSRVTINGITSRQQAYNEGMYMRKTQRLLRQNIIFHTGLEGHIPNFGDLIRVSYDVPRWSTSGMIRSATNLGGSDWSLVLTNAVTVVAGSKLAIRYKDGTVRGPWDVSVSGYPNTVYLIGAADFPTDLTFDGLSQNPIFFFGQSSDLGMECRVMTVRPSSNDTVEIAAVNYIGAELYDSDGDTPPAGNNIYGSLPPVNDVPDVKNLKVSATPQLSTQAVATWDPIDQAQYYILELSYDGDSWTTLGGGQITGTSFTFDVLPKYIYVRVAAVNTGAGAFVYWFGNAPSLTPSIPTGLIATRGLGGSMSLKWDQSLSPNLFFYRVYRALINDSAEKLLIGTALANQYIDAPLALNTTYYYWVTQVNTSNYESSVSVVSGDTTNDGPVNPVTPANPAPATCSVGATVDGVGTPFGYIDVTVPAFPDGAVMVQVRYKPTSSESGWQVAAEMSAAGTCRISDLATNTAYNVETIALDAYFTPSGSVAATSSPFTTPKNVNTPATPVSAITAKINQGAAVQLQWTLNTEKDIDYYKIYRATVNNPAFAALTGISYSNTTLDIDGLVNFTTYYYWFTAVNTSGLESNKSPNMGSGITPTQSSLVNSIAPNNPSAATCSNGSPYVASDGSVYTSIIVSVPAKPTVGSGNIPAAAYQQLWIRKYVASPAPAIDTVTLLGFMTNTGTVSVPIPDLSPGVVYDIGTIAYNEDGKPTALIAASNSPYTAPSLSSAPAVPTGLAISKVGVVPKVNVTTSPLSYHFGCMVGWDPVDRALYPDFDHYEVKAVSTNDSTSTGRSWTTQNAGPSGDEITVDNFIILYNPSATPGYVFVRTVNTSGVKSAWCASGTSSLVANLNSQCTYGVGGAAALDVGTAANTVAAGNDSRVVGAAQKSNNLSDLVAPATARSNLGLGSAAVLADTAVAKTANNLSDLANAASARGNLGLGTRATENSGDAINIGANNVQAGGIKYNANPGNVISLWWDGSNVRVLVDGTLQGTIPNP